MRLSLIVSGLLSCTLVIANSATAADPELREALDRIRALEQQVGLTSQLDTASGIQQCECRTDAGGCQGCQSSGGRSDSAHPMELVYDRGFLMRPVDAAKTPFTMKINSWLQLRHSFFDSDGATPDQNDFEFERLRLTFGGTALNPNLKYYFQLDADDNQNQRADMLDYYISYDVGHDQLDLESGQLGIRAGRWKIPFNRTRYTSGLNLQFADRSMASVFFDIDRSVGVSLYGKTPTSVPVNWEFALTNGIRTNGVRPNRVGDIDRNLGISGRIFSDVLGEWGSDYESDISWHEELAVRLGAGFAYSREDILTGTVEATRQRVVDSGMTITSILPAGATDYSVSLFALSADFRWQGWSLSTEYYFRTLSSFSGVSVPQLFDHGFLLQSGYFIVPKKFEAFARWSSIMGDSGTLGVSDQSADAVSGGVAWWIKGRNLKLLFDVTQVNGTPINDSAVGFRPGDDGLLFRTQLQILF